jgi:hypothetical protein
LSSTTAQNTQLTGLTVGSPTRIRWSVTESGCTKIKNLDINPAAVSPSNITDGGVCQICPVKNSGTFKFFDNNGKLIAKIEDAVSPTIELGNTEVCAAIDPSVQNIIDDNGNVQPYLQRHFSIKPTTNTTSNVTLYFTATEFNNLKSSCNATQYAFTNVNQLIVSKFPNGGNNIYTLPNTNGATDITPTASGIDANGYYYITVPVSTFSTFYIKPKNIIGARFSAEFIDNKPLVDTSVVAINNLVLTDKDIHVSVFPNPVNDELKVFVTTAKRADASVIIYDLNTNVLFQQSILLNHGYNTFNIPVGLLSPGMYIIEISGEKGVLYKGKIIKQ